MFRRCQGQELLSLSDQRRRCGVDPILVGGPSGGCIVVEVVDVGYFVGRKILVEWWTAVVAPSAGAGAGMVDVADSDGRQRHV